MSLRLHFYPNFYTLVFSNFLHEKSKWSTFTAPTSEAHKWLEVVHIKKILVRNLLIYICLHCIRRSLWIVKALPTLILGGLCKKRTMALHVVTWFNSISSWRLKSIAWRPPRLLELQLLLPLQPFLLLKPLCMVWVRLARSRELQKFNWLCCTPILNWRLKSIAWRPPRLL